VIAAESEQPAAGPAERQPPVAEARGVRVLLGDATVLRGVDLEVRAGSKLALVGPNGAGKSTLLRVLAGLLRPTAGEVWIEGRSLPRDPWSARRAVGMVGHQSMLHPDLTARENLMVYARLYGLDNAAGRVDAMLERVGLSARRDSRLPTLSRGMVQRLALARALLHEPALLLLDEAETGLDARAHDLLASTLHGGQTAVLASHDLGFVREVADEVVFLANGRVVSQHDIGHAGAAELHALYAEALAHRTRDRPPAVVES
jgi:ABC-type multidrug transport system ATPase subunit